jgi:hypothetical protein
MTPEQLTGLGIALFSSGGVGLYIVQKLLDRRGKKHTDEQKAWRLVRKIRNDLFAMEDAYNELRRIAVNAPCIDTDELPRRPVIGGTGAIETQGDSK